MLLSAVVWLVIGLWLIIITVSALIQIQPLAESDALLGPILFLWGFFNFEIASGLFKMIRRAWILAVISTLIGLFFGGLGIGIFMTAIESNPYSYQLKGILIGIGIFQLLYLLASYGDFRKD